MRRTWPLALLLILLLGWTGVAHAQSPTLELFTRFPDQIVEPGESVSVSMTVRNNGEAPQRVSLEVTGLPEGWEAHFLGGGRTIRGIYVEAGKEASFTLRVKSPKEAGAGTVRLEVIAQGQGAVARFPVSFQIQEKVPPKLSFNVELPTLRGTVKTSFRFEGNLKNEGDEDITVNLTAEAPEGFQVSFKPSFGSQEVTSLPVKAGESRRLYIEVKVPQLTEAGTYPIRVTARGGGAEATLDLAVEVTGQPELRISTPDGRLSGEATAGQESTIQLILENRGTAPAYNVELSAFEPSGWSVEFEPKAIPQVKVGEQVKVTAKVRPAAKAVAGDYMVTLRVQAEGGVSESVDFRVTVKTSTLWGIVGILLIAVAVGVVGLAVARFGRR